MVIDFNSSSGLGVENKGSGPAVLKGYTAWDR